MRIEAKALAFGLFLFAGGTALSADSFFTLTPCRIIDTRNTATPLTGNQLFTLSGGTCGVPSWASAASVNVTLVTPTASVSVGFVQGNLAPTGTNVVSAAAGAIRAAAAVLPLATDRSGTVLAFPTFMPPGAQTDLLLDVNGYFAPDTAGAPQPHIPSQFVAKMYTDALGRIPDPSGWQNGIDTFNALGCSASSLQHFGSFVLTSSEYNGIPYDNAARLLTLYRTVLNREPDSSGFNSNLATLSSGVSWSTMVNAFFSSSEFQQLAPSICYVPPPPPAPPTDPAYSFGSSPVIDIPVSGAGFQGTGDQLQSVLNGTGAGQTVWLAQKAVIRLSSTLVIPAGVTVATTGSPMHNSYALMARLVRAAAFNAPAVQLNSGAKLQYTWVDGQRGQVGFDATRVNIQLQGGSGTEVSNCMITNTAGGTNLKALGTGEGFPCAGNNVLTNLVTGYSTSHFNALWSDGLTIACESTNVYDNEIIDATDVGIVMFDSGTATQQSQVHHNRILNSGNSAFGGIVADPWLGAGITHDFSGSSVYDNTLWTGMAPAHIEIVLSLGNRAWFGTNSAGGTGASFSTNTTGSFSANANTGIVVSGMLNAYVQSNSLSLNIANYSNGPCPMVAVAAAVSAGYASGSIQSYTDVNVPACI